MALCANVLVAAPKNKEKKEEGFVFTTVKENPITPVKNQHRSSTCWSFSAMAFFESEVLRMQNKTVDLSEMFLVHKSMIDRGELHIQPPRPAATTLCVPSTTPTECPPS